LLTDKQKNRQTDRQTDRQTSENITFWRLWRSFNYSVSWGTNVAYLLSSIFRL